ncbi:unnamed protein product [Malus baccata var. baccata]
MSTNLPRTQQLHKTTLDGQAPPTMDQIWETILRKISATFDDLQKTLKASQARNHLNYFDFKRRIKALDNTHGTTSQTQVLVSKFKLLSTSNLSGQPIGTSLPDLMEILDPNQRTE